MIGGNITEYNLYGYTKYHEEINLEKKKQEIPKHLDYLKLMKKTNIF